VLLGVLLDAGHHERGLALERVAELGAGGAARRLRLRRKGRIEPGADADLALVDVAGETAFTAETLQHRHPHSPWAGRTLHGRVARTLVRGATVFADGRVAGPPAGRLVIPETTEES
jgi:allantoinase